MTDRTTCWVSPASPSLRQLQPDWPPCHSSLTAPRAAPGPHSPGCKVHTQLELPWLSSTQPLPEGTYELHPDAASGSWSWPSSVGPLLSPTLHHLPFVLLALAGFGPSPHFPCCRIIPVFLGADPSLMGVGLGVVNCCPSCQRHCEMFVTSTDSEVGLLLV